MAKYVTWTSRVRHWLYPAILCGMFLTGCSGGGGNSGGGAPPGSVPSGTATDTLIQLSWAPSPDAVEGYIILHGPTAETAAQPLPELPLAVFENRDEPHYSLNAGTDLSLSYGDRVCFRLRSYVRDQVSALSEPACTEIR